MKPNVPLLRQTMAHIEAHPEEWYQGSWRCDTGMCFAGHTAIIDGATWTYPDITDDEIFETELVTTPGREIMPVRDYASHALGLELGEAALLFAASNDLDDLRQIVDELCAEGEVTP